MDIEVSCIIPVKNGGERLVECLQSLLRQEFNYGFEVSIFDDGSDDRTPDTIATFYPLFCAKQIRFNSARENVSGGVGYAKNRAVALSTGRFLCFCDADDINFPSRISEQFEFCKKLDDPLNCIVGTLFNREPKDSTPRFIQWACSLNHEQLHTQIYTSFGPTVVAPTWFLSRQLFDKVGGFNEIHKNGFPEDLDFFYRSLQIDAKIHRVDQILLTYRYHPGCSTFSVTEKLIWEMRINRLENDVLNFWDTITIWNAGKQGKQFFRSLTPANQAKVVAMCDVDKKKLLRKFFHVYDEKLKKVTRSIPIINYRDATPPVIICVKLYMTGGEFERHLAEKAWKEGVNFFHFN